MGTPDCLCERETETKRDREVVACFVDDFVEVLRRTETRKGRVQLSSTSQPRAGAPVLRSLGRDRLPSASAGGLVEPGVVRVLRLWAVDRAARAVARAATTRSRSPGATRKM